MINRKEDPLDKYKPCAKCVFFTLFIGFVILISLIILPNSISPSFPREFRRYIGEKSSTSNITNVGEVSLDRHQVGIWLDSHSFRNLTREESTKLVYSVADKVESIVLDLSPSGENDDFSSSIPALLADRNRQDDQLHTSAALVFHGKESFWKAKSLADEANGIFPGSVRILLYSSSDSSKMSLLDEAALPSLILAREIFGKSYKLGVLMDISECWNHPLQYFYLKLNPEVEQVIPLVDTVFIRVKHDYYTAFSRVKRKGGGGGAAIVLPHRIQMAAERSRNKIHITDPAWIQEEIVNDVGRCEDLVKKERADVDFVTVVECDKKIQFNTKYTQEEEVHDVSKCWQLMDNWAAGYSPDPTDGSFRFQQEKRKKVVLPLREAVGTSGWWNWRAE